MSFPESVAMGGAIHDPIPKTKEVHIMHTLWQHTALDEDEGGCPYCEHPHSGAQEMSIVRVSAEMQGGSYSDVTFSYTGKSGRQTQTKRDVH